MTNKDKSWEELKEKNPWKELFENKSIEELRKSICECNTEFVIQKDKTIIRNHNNDPKCKEPFVLFKLPKPFRGNLKDPKLVILSLNPGFNERVNKTLFNILDTKFQKDFIEICRNNLLLEDNCLVITPGVDDVCDNGYWTRQLSDLKKDGANLSKIGLIQFIPYASKNFDSWKDEANLESQKFTQNIIQRILKESENTLFLIMRSKDKWEKLIGDEMKKYESRFLYSRNPRC